ncbi:MAG: hypothetical protein QM756_33825 [Polyangiaceae bacterium]
MVQERQAVWDDLEAVNEGSESKAARERLLEASQAPEDAALLLSLLLRMTAGKKAPSLREFEVACRELLGLPSSLKLDCDDFEGLDDLADELDEREDVASAGAVRRYALLLHPDESAAVFSWAQHLEFDLEDFAQAEAAYEQGLARFPNDADLNYGFGALLANRFERFDAALPYLERAKTLDPLDARYWSHAAVVAGALGRLLEMKNGALKALALAGDSASDEASRARAEAGLCLYLGGPGAERAERLTELVANLARGDSVWAMSLPRLAKLAAEAGHPHAQWLPLLVRVASEEEKLKRLESWPEGNAALKEAKQNPRKTRKVAELEDPYYVFLSSPPVGHDVPLLLHEFGAWLKQRERGSLGWFDALAAEAVDWPSPELERLQRESMSFLKLADGSRVLLVERGRDQPAAVGLLGSEGECYGLAPSFEDFLLLWSKGKSNVGDLDDEEARKGHKALSKWLKERGVTPPQSSDFDFAAWLETGDGRLNPPEAARLFEPSPTFGRLGPKLQTLARLVGRRADAPELRRYVKEELELYLPPSIRQGLQHVTSDEHGVSLLLDKNVLNDAYPPIVRAGEVCVPHLARVRVKPAFGETVLGVPWKSRDAKAVEKVLGPPSETRSQYPDGTGELISYWRFELDSAAQTELEIGVEEGLLDVAVGVRQSYALADFPDVGTGLFVAYAAARGLLDEGRFAEHAELVERVKARAARGSELIAEALPRGLWQDHLRDDRELRSASYGWFHGLKKGSIQKTLIKVFGQRDDEPALDEDSWAALDQVAPAFDAVFKKWLPKAR